MKKLINWCKNNINALSLGAFMAVVPLVGDIVWWARDFLLGEWTWHLAFIIVSFTISIIGAIIAMVWYHRTKDDDKNELLQEISYLKYRNAKQDSLINKLELRIKRLEEENDFTND